MYFISFQVQLNIVGKALDYMQSDTSCFSKVYATWLRLLRSEELTNYKATIESRFNEAMQPFHALAYMTDPTLLEKVPIPKDQEDAERVSPIHSWFAILQHQRSRHLPNKHVC